ncbi:MAG: efflux RND transporter permease subunit [Candidatus Krumholzibacteria bacterium]|jgi:HAE1 family hydrophobic/amphiphilic exporter-1|nr:efflux RND transporter permease subunit [Candidatus Krumholzibacteria bacterium]
MKIIEISIRRKVTVAMFTLAVILFGTVSFMRLKINLLPELTYPTLTIRTEYSGAAPAEIENLISKPVEEALGVVKRVNRISSISRSGQSDVILEFEWGTDMDRAGLDVREKLDALELPLEIKRPSILRFDPSLDPIIRFGFRRKNPAAPSSGPGGHSTASPVDSFSEDELKFLRRFSEEEIKKELESALGVAAVKVSGGLEDEIQILVDQGRLSQLDLPLEQLARQVGAENVNLSGGRLEEGSQQYLVRTLNEFKSVEEIGNIIISTKEGKPTYLKDVATVMHGYKEREAIIRLNSVEAVEIALYKEGDANTVAVAREVEKILDRTRKILPENYELIKVYDQSTFIKQAVTEVINAAVIGGLLAVIILYFFLRSFWATVIISLSIPVSVIATFNLMYGSNLTLNIMSLGGIALGIGMLVDNSIVVLENISRHLKNGKTAIQASIDGAGEVGMAVTASTLTTVAVFIPLVFVKGVAGQLFRDQALTVTFSLLASLVVALTLIPMLSSLQKRGAGEIEEQPVRDEPRTRFGRWERRTRRLLAVTVPVFAVRSIFKAAAGVSKGIMFILRPQLDIFQKTYEGVEERYCKLLKWSLDHKSRVIFAAIALFALSLALIPRLGVELIPQLSQGEFGVEFKLPPGTPLETTARTMAGVQRSAEKIVDIKTTFSVAGSGNRMDANPEQGGENWGEMNIVMIPGSKRADEEKAISAMRNYLARVPDLQYKFFHPTLFTFKTPVEIEVTGFDLTQLKRISDDIALKLESSSRFADVKSTMQAGHPEIRIQFDRERAASLGFAVYQVADRVVSQVKGDVATRYSWHDRKIDVLVRARESDRNSIEKIRRLVINPESDRPVTLDAVADITVDTGPGEIRRIDQERSAIVTANLNHGDLGSAAAEINSIISGVAMPLDFTAKLAGQNREMSASFRSLQLALLLAVFLVYLVMASQFESFLHPFVILFTIPLALIGSVLALFITRSTISVVVFIGLILLAGIVVNNAIILIDFINKIRAGGAGKAEAILAGGRSRLRPILMTTITTVLGLLPLALGIGEGAELRAPMAITVIGGLTVSTLLTLLVIPVVYALIDRKR